MMQKKVEQLPGLSNVSGKYTKKCSTDGFPHTTLPTKFITEFSRSNISIPAIFSDTENTKLLSNPTNSLYKSSRLATTDPKILAGRLDHARENHLLESNNQHVSAVSCPSWPSSFNVNRTFNTSNTEAKLTRVKSNTQFTNSADMVKSSSSNSVISLNQKPTGIILAMPSNSNTKTPLKFRYTNRNSNNVSDSEVGFQRGHSTPYPTRQSHFASFNQIHTTAAIGESSTVNSMISTPNARSSSRVRRLDSTNLVSPYIIQNQRTVQSDTNRTRSGINRSNIQNRIYPRSSSWQCPGANISSSNTTESVPLWKMDGRKTPSSTNNKNTTISQIDESRSNRLPTPNSTFESLGSASIGHEIINQADSGSYLQVNTASSIPRISTSCEAMPLPGPQYTRVALEHYLSELLAQEGCAPPLIADVTAGEDHTHRDRTGAVSPFDANESLSSLQFLYNRIESELQGIRAAAPTTNKDLPKSASRNELARVNLSHTASSKHEGFLADFSEAELRYLLAAVRELIALRSCNVNACKLGTSSLDVAHASPLSSTHDKDDDNGAIDMMHKRLPVGFQHFKRYLDNKFGPDYNNRLHHTHADNSGTSHCVRDQHTVASSISDDLSRSSGVTEHTGRQAPHSSDVHFTHSPGHGSPMHNQKPISSAAPNQDSVQDTPSTSRRVCASRSFECGGTQSSYPARFNRYIPAQTGYESQDALRYPSSTSSHVPQSTAIITGKKTNTESSDHFGSRRHVSPCPTPECYYPDVYLPHRMRWNYGLPFYCCIPTHSPSEQHLLPPHSIHWLRNFHGANSPNSSSTFYPCQEPCSCGFDSASLMYGPHPWTKAQYFGPMYNQFLRCSDTTQPVIECIHSHPSAPLGSLSSNEGFYNPNAAADVTHRSGGLVCQECNNRYLNSSPMVRAVPHQLPASPTFDWALFNSAGASSRPSGYHPGPFHSFNSRIPRSGSAGAGFGCGSSWVTDNGNSSAPHFFCNPAHRELNFGVEYVVPDNQTEQSSQQGVLHSAQPYQQNPRHVSAAFSCATTSTALTNRSLITNSLSVNDLSVYRTKLPAKSIRPSWSSFELTPDFPCEPTLMLSGFAEFYTKLATFIELDNNLQLSVPSGWCERRSSFGRSYYACDQTKQASWHHPTFGLLVPLGWERIDSCQHGVYYQHLLIPHCQRHHPNLWIPGPLKDPAVEHENFFSDLRYLQSSMRHSISASNPDLESYKLTNSSTCEDAFLRAFHCLDVEEMVEVTRGLDQLFYIDLHALVVYFEQQRMRIVSAMFTSPQCETIFSCVTNI